MEKKTEKETKTKTTRSKKKEVRKTVLKTASLKRKEKKEKGKEESRKKEKMPKYFEAVGRRKTSTARVRLLTHEAKGIKVNDKSYKDYFPVFSLQKKIEEPLETISSLDKFGISIKVKGGGISSQAEACRHGIARALVLLNPYFKKRLKKAGYLTRDPRMRERKKFGLKRARRAPQWSKR